jgi:SWI/SNF-related matrix-associated actin-dependent regulator 1 of chromatin subfamily A
VLTNFILPDYRNLSVDFDRYDKLSMSKDSNRRLREHQKEAVKFLLSRKKCILADDPGYGKTSELIVAAIEGNFDSVLIICPASIKSTWKKELLWYVPERDITIVEGIQGKTKNELEEYLGYCIGRSGKKVSELKEEAKEQGKWKDNRFVIVNFDILDEVYKIPESRSKENIEKAYNESPMLQYIKNKKTLIIIDEAHVLSNMSSIRYKIIRDLVKRGNPDSIYAATGTPITNNPQNFFCVLQFLNDPITDDYNYYMERYCDAKKFPKNSEEKEKRDRISTNFIQSKGKSNWYALTDAEKQELNKIIERNVKMITVANGSSNLEELKERVSHIYLRRLKEDLKGMVKKTIHEVFYDLTSEQKNEYEKLWEEYENAQYEENPDKELNKELIEGAIYRRYLSNQMVPNTIKLVNEIISRGEKVIIGCCYDEELYTLKDYFGDSAVVYNGKLNSKEKDRAQNEFMTNPNIKCFVANLKSAGVGLTLTVAKYLIFNNFDFVSGNNEQFQDRIHRLNQTEDVHIYYQIFRGTQYEKMWDIVFRKKYIIDQVIKKESEK